MILTAIKYKNQFFNKFEEVSMRNGYGGHGIGAGSWKEFKPLFGSEPVYYTKRGIGEILGLIIVSMQEGIIEPDNLQIIIKNDKD